MNKGNLLIVSQRKVYFEIGGEKKWIKLHRKKRLVEKHLMSKVIK